MKLIVLVAVFALSAIGAANASAASTFTASATGEITGKALETQKFKTSAGTVECSKADISGTIESTASTEQDAIVNYTECSAFGFPVHITANIRFKFTSLRRVHIKLKISLTVTGGIFGECTITIGEQEVGTVTYTNNSGKLKVTPEVTGIAYTSTGGICGSSGTNGTYTGATEVERVGGGTISWDE